MILFIAGFLGERCGVCIPPLNYKFGHCILIIKLNELVQGEHSMILFIAGYLENDFGVHSPLGNWWVYFDNKKLMN